jgi:hypothetical protein
MAHLSSSYFHQSYPIYLLLVLPLTLQFGTQILLPKDSLATATRERLAPTNRGSPASLSHSK